VSGPTDFPPAARDAILTWYGSRARALSFRRTTDPYAILVSEAMAQQTQAARAGEAWTRFMGRFPTVDALAAASPADVLRAWQGLGYNRRAINLWLTARRIADEFGGRVPSDIAVLQSLPGIGPYTARAIAALAFGVPVGAVDTNVRRVLGRVVAGDTGVLAPSELQQLADGAVPIDRPGAWTHAVMDVGATLCHPRRPACGTCPARPWCRYASARAAEVGQGRVVPTRPTGAAARSVHEPPAPFRTTSRWLRGRILDRLRDAPHGEWVVLDASIGEHDPFAVERAMRALANDGLLELAGDEPPDRRARLPIA